MPQYNVNEITKALRDSFKNYTKEDLIQRWNSREYLNAMKEFNKLSSDAFGCQAMQPETEKSNKE